MSIAIMRAQYWTFGRGGQLTAFGDNRMIRVPCEGLASVWR